MSNPCDDLVFLFIIYLPAELLPVAHLTINGNIVVYDTSEARLFIVGTRIPDPSEDPWLQLGHSTLFTNVDTQQLLTGVGDYWSLISPSTETYTLCGKVLFNGTSMYLGTPYEGIVNAYEIPNLGCNSVPTTTTTPTPTTTGNPCATTCLPYVPTTSNIKPLFTRYPPINTINTTISLDDAPISNNLNHEDIVTTNTTTYSTTNIPTPTTTSIPTTTIKCDFGCDHLKF